MTKNELIDAIAAKTGATKTATRALVDAFTETLSRSLEEQGQITLSGFGAFVVRERAPRAVRSLHSGEKLTTKRTRTVAFKTSAALKQRINGVGE